MAVRAQEAVSGPGSSRSFAVSSAWLRWQTVEASPCGLALARQMPRVSTPAAPTPERQAAALGLLLARVPPMPVALTAQALAMMSRLSRTQRPPSSRDRRKL